MTISAINYIQDGSDQCVRDGSGMDGYGDNKRPFRVGHGRGYFANDPDLDRLNFGYRVTYKLAGGFKMVQRARRIVYYQL